MKKYLLIGAIGVLAAACRPAANDAAPAVEKDTAAAPAATPPAKTEDHQEFYDNGALKIEGKKVNGKRHGQWTSYYPDGKKWSETTFDNGVKSGPTRSFYENGMMRYSGQYKNDEKAGTWNFYNDAGVLEKTADLSAPGAVDPEK